jgi:hypothetical protein
LGYSYPLKFAGIFREVILDPAAADTTFSQLDYVQEALHDAERMLHFASETGLTVDDGTKKAVLDARAAFAKGLDEPTTANLLTALAKLQQWSCQSLQRALRYSLKKFKGGTLTGIRLLCSP